MVLKLQEDLKGCYNQIVMNSLSGGCTVLILVANDIDAIASSKILVVFLS